MGVGATVRCTCLEQGIIPDDLRPYVRVDDEGYLTFALPHEGNETLAERYYAWYQSGCPHEEKDYASEDIGSWSAYRTFQHALDVVGAERFPTLLRELPDANGGSTAPDAARQMLAELHDFCSVSSLGTCIVLIDDETGDEIAQAVDAYDGVFVIGPNGVRIGIHEDGLFVGHDVEEDGESYIAIDFMARRIAQTVVHEDGNAGNKASVTYRDLDAGNEYTCASAVHVLAGLDRGKPETRYPQRMHVRSRARTPDEFEAVTRGLKAICAASIETGNPIRWC